MANTIGTSTTSTALRRKKFASTLQHTLKNALVAEKICKVDRSDLKYISNPYSSRPTAAIQAVAGTYSVSAFTTTDDNLTVTDEVIYGEHIFDFEDITADYNLMTDRMEEMAYAVAFGVDKFVLNNLCEDATGAYTTDAGGFTTPANIPVIFANLISKVAGYEASVTRNGYFIVLENTDIVGLLQSQVAVGFSYADAALNNGLVGSLMGVDIYVVRSGTFVSETIGSTTVTNASHRVFGVKGVATYASPRGIRYEEKQVSGKTGTEIAVVALVGFKLWTQNAGLVVDITLA